MKKKKIAIQLSEVNKTYIIRSEKPTFVETLLDQKKTKEYKVLQSIDLSIYKGEKVGIIGRNGAGKTTLLKIIVGITQPQKGKVIVHGKIVSLINLMAGFHPEMSGYDNIIINGLLIGMTADEIEKKRKNIIRFADIGGYIYAPLHTYSSGMRLRLGFAVAIHSCPDILILDEGLSAGDEQFKKKANKKIEQLFNKNKTILVVSHWLKFLKENCNRIIWLEKGKIKKEGSIKLLDEYQAFYTGKKK